jgi:D-arabinose 1-dehydrogenase-like Zn-dependent alcohol dehydrogenase
MRAALLERPQTPLVLTEVPLPDVGPREALVRVRACGVCHTDLHLADGLFKTFGYDPFPLIPGHEIAGEVESWGAEVSGLRRGDRVAVYWWHSCGRCRCCLSGEEESCLEGLAKMQATGLTRNGGYAPWVAVPAHCLVPLPPEIEFAAAAPFGCAGLTVYAALVNADLRPGRRVAILGLGGLGHLGLQIARAMGAEVVALTSSESKQEIAIRLGAHHVLLAKGRDFGKRLRDLGGVDVAVSTTMDFQAIRDVMDGLAPQGTLVLAALTAGRLPIDPRTFVLAQQRVMGSFLGSRVQLQELLHLAALHGIRPLVERYSLEQVHDVYQRLRENKVQFRAVLEPE